MSRPIYNTFNIIKLIVNSSLTKVLVFVNWCFTFVIMISIAQLNDIRKVKKVSMLTISKRLNLSRAHVSGLFNGKSRMTVDQMVDICTEIGVNIEFCYQKMN